MSLPARYPKAKWKADGTGVGSWNNIGKWKLVLHTTETSGLPSYNHGSLAPHLTYFPRYRTWHQHSELTDPAESLVAYDDYMVIQVEIVCYSQKSITTGIPWRKWVGNLKKKHYQDIADFYLWLAQYIDVEPTWPGKQALSYSEANRPGFRYSHLDFINYNGILAHQHVPSNTHWDTGAFSWNQLLTSIKGGSSQQEETMYPIYVGDGRENQRPEKAEDIKYLQRKMRNIGINLAVDGTLNQALADKFFEFVGSPTGGSFISGEEAAIFDRKYAKFYGRSGLSEADVNRLIEAAKLKT